MSYTVDDDEVAIILRPVAVDKNGDWTGDLNTGLVVGDSEKVAQLWMKSSGVSSQVSVV